MAVSAPPAMRPGDTAPPIALSIVVPAGPGDEAWRRLWPRLPHGPGIERLLVLASTTQQGPVPTLEGRLVRAPAGRARQLNAGLAEAVGSTVWFLHADSLPEPTACQSAIAFAASVPPCLGYFALAFYDGPRLMALNALGANVRSRLLGMPFGDQGLMAPRSLFARLGGFDESLARGEDHALVWAAHRAGVPVRQLAGRVATSARRYVEQGWWRTTREHLVLSWRQRRDFGRRGP